MATFLVTGVAGFVGSHVAEALLQRGDRVTGVDCFTDYYPRWMKERNLATLQQHPAFTFIEGDVLKLDLLPLMTGAEAVIHLAAQAGVRASWGNSFQVYTDNNILATQRLLEAARQAAPRKFVYASSSSIYGDTLQLPMAETHPQQPVSPYGVSKLAGEQLVWLYHHNYGLPTFSLRFFTVYGPRQRPDMGFHRFSAAVYDGRPLEIFGDGDQTRDFTFVSDIVTATLRAADTPHAGVVANIGGGNRVTVNYVLELFSRITGQRLELKHIGDQKGDMRHTYASIDRAQKLLDYKPNFDLETGLALEWRWYCALRGAWGGD